ncbi:MAG: hypothetical protein R3264_04330, partial [Anaerolineae bacterium]|nr:hypothetical protein [Anaerolineae bacterium]
AEAALNRGLPVFVSLNDTSHNRALLDQGALLLTDAGEVVEMVQQAIIDAALLPENDEAVAPTQPAAPSSANLTDPTEDFGLRYEEVEPLETGEALEVLSLGGEIPDLLRRRLEQKSDEDAED